MKKKNSKKTTLHTEYASAERVSKEELEKEIKDVASLSFISEIYNAVSEIVLILNKYRQIVFYNDNLVKMLGKGEEYVPYGKRPGEAVDCVHAIESEGGCGTTEFCKTCGAVNSILQAQKGEKNEKECRIIQTATGNALNLSVQSTPIKLNGEECTIFSVKDISHEKRRKLLERVFFHNILNTAGAVRSISELLYDASEEELVVFRRMIYEGSDRLIEEIQSQRDLVSAENNDLTLSTSEINIKNFLENLIAFYRVHEVGKDKIIKLDEFAEDLKIISDKTILARVIGNMIENALEACNIGEIVTVGAIVENEKVTLWVHNPTFIPRNIQLQLFQRAFSTKGQNRGIGTYSMKLFSERFLNGEVTFMSSETDGTIFKATYPKILTTKNDYDIT